MQKTLETITVKTCESLPFNWTLFEENGFCTKLHPNCYYAQRQETRKYRCTKQTYTQVEEKVHIIIS